MRSLVAVACFLTACGPSDGSSPETPLDGGDIGGVIDADPSQFATIEGTVWVPGNAPGLVPAGHEIPVAEALVYARPSRPERLVAGADCRPCSELPHNGVLTDHKGNFVLQSVPPGTQWLIIEKGDFRLEQQIEITPKEYRQLPAEATTLPNRYAPEEGMTIPKIALASGASDTLEDILGKMSLGAVDSIGAFVGSSADGVFDIYTNGGSSDSVAIGGLDELVDDLNLMLQYDIILIPCSGSMHNHMLQEVRVLRNIRDYVAAGGKLYVTDWSGEWLDNVFPAQIQLEGSFNDTPASAYNSATDTWDTSQFGSANGSPSYTSPGAETIDSTLHSWLHEQMGPFASGGEGSFNASDLTIEGNWNRISALHPVTLGVDEEGQTIVDEPTSYVIGGDSANAPKMPLTVTSEPAGCGRVLYSTYHTTHSRHQGLAPQERVLLYLMMEIGTCKEGPIIID